LVKYETNLQKYIRDVIQKKRTFLMDSIRRQVIHNDGRTLEQINCFKNCYLKDQERVRLFYEFNAVRKMYAEFQQYELYSKEYKTKESRMKNLDLFFEK
jgi:hypothetical protein